MLHSIIHTKLLPIDQNVPFAYSPYLQPFYTCNIYLFSYNLFLYRPFIIDSTNVSLYWQWQNALNLLILCNYYISIFRLIAFQLINVFIYLSPKKAHRTPYEMGKGVLTANLVSVFVCIYYTAFNLVIGVHFAL